MGRITDQMRNLRLYIALPSLHGFHFGLHEKKVVETCDTVMKTIHPVAYNAASSRSLSESVMNFDVFAMRAEPVFAVSDITAHFFRYAHTFQYMQKTMQRPNNIPNGNPKWNKP